MKFLFITFLLFVLFVFLFGFSVLRMLFNGLFGTRPKPNNNRSQSQQKTNQSSKRTTQTRQTKKIITPDEGEYVDFEEIID